MRIRLTLCYRGTRYAGWQVQPHAPTIQGSLQAAVGRVLCREVKVIGASRTDAGVHALGQVCHFDSPDSLPPHRWLRILSRMLADDIRVIGCDAVADDFHARFSARRKTYLYHVDPASIASPFLSPFSWHRPGINSLTEMREAAAQLLGPINQRAFATRPEGDRDIRPIDEIGVEVERLVTFSVRGRSFMRHAVRSMVGSLLEVGYGRRSAADIRAMAQATPGHLPAVKAPPQGLFLAQVEYGDQPPDSVLNFVAPRSSP